jgi:hypothetical protein
MPFSKYLSVLVLGLALCSAAPAFADGQKLIVMVPPSNNSPAAFARAKPVSGMPKQDPDPFKSAMHGTYSHNLALSDTAATERNKAVTAAIGAQKEGLAQLVAMQNAIEAARAAPQKEQYGPPSPMQATRMNMTPTVLPSTK